MPKKPAKDGGTVTANANARMGAPNGGLGLLASVNESVKKSPRKSPKLRGVAVDPSLRGKGPKKGAPNAGRPPDKFKEWCRSMVSRDDVEEGIVKILEAGSNDPMYLGALKWLSDHGYGRPKESIDLTSGGMSLAELITAGNRRARGDG